MIKQIVISLSLCSLVACAAHDESYDGDASKADTGRGDCISRSTIRGYSVLDDSNLIIDGIGRRKYHITLKRRGHRLNSSRGIVFDSRDIRVCARYSDVIVTGQGSSDRLRIQTIRKINAEEHNDLLIRFGKREPEIEQTPVPQEVEGADVEELDPAAAD